MSADAKKLRWRVRLDDEVPMISDTLDDLLDCLRQHLEAGVLGEVTAEIVIDQIAMTDAELAALRDL